jgi:hypothetical protein
MRKCGGFEMALDLAISEAEEMNESLIKTIG